MKTLLGMLISALLFGCVGNALAQYGTLTFRADISGEGIWMDGSAKTIAPMAQISIDIYTTNSGGTSPRLAWSSPFSITGSGIEIEWGDTALFPQPLFSSFWNLFQRTYAESWDGILPDLFNFTGIANSSAGYAGDLGEILALKLSLRFRCPQTTQGILCIGQGDAANDIYDWLFDDPQPSFATVCWPVLLAPCGYAPTIDNCISTVTARVKQQSQYQFHATDIEGDFRKFEILSGPGAIDSVSGSWSYTPALSDAWQVVALEIRAIDDCYYMHGCSDGREYCRPQVNIFGICGDADGNGIINILDISKIIYCLYINPTGCTPTPAYDATGSAGVNIQDITRLIGYLYSSGAAPACPPWP